MEQIYRYTVSGIVGAATITFLAGCEDEWTPSWKTTNVPGVYAGYETENYMRVSNQTNGWVTAFVYFGNYQGTLNLTDLLQSGASVQHVTISPLSWTAVMKSGEYHWVWVYYGRWTIDYQTRNIVPE